MLVCPRHRALGDGDLDCQNESSHLMIGEVVKLQDEGNERLKPLKMPSKISQGRLSPLKCGTEYDP